MPQVIMLHEENYQQQTKDIDPTHHEIWKKTYETRYNLKDLGK